MDNNNYENLQDQSEELNQNIINKKNKQKNRINSIFDKSNNKEELEDNKVKFQEEIVNSKKSEKIKKLRCISVNDMIIQIEE